jgi:hypothetical protein
MHLLISNGEVHMTDSYISVTLDFAANNGTGGMDKLTCKKLVHGMGSMTFSLGYKNVARLPILYQPANGWRWTVPSLVPSFPII